jgi:hypothetical protein
MQAPTDVFVTHDQLFALGAQVEGPFSKLSPLAITDEQRQAAASDRVLNPDLVRDDGRLRTELVPAFQVLAHAKSFTSVAYLCNTYMLETAIYYPEAGSGLPPVSLSNTGEGFQLQSPSRKEGVLELLRQYFGDSLLRKIELETELPLMDMWMLLGVIDAGRRARLNSILAKEAGPPPPISVKDIHAGLEGSDPELQWLAPYFDDCLSLATLALGEVEAGVKRLTQHGMVSVSDDRVMPGPLVEELIEEFLLVNGHLRVRAAGLDRSGEVVTSDIRGIQGRAGTILVWSHDNASIDLVSLSPAQALVLVSSLVENPSAIVEEGAPPLAAGAPKAPPETLS